MNDTIAAIATADGDGAISIIRVSGGDAIDKVSSVSSTDLHKAEGYTIQYGYILDHGEPVDQVLYSIYRAPKSYTGEDSVEISCHGGRFITRKVLSVVLGTGIRMARKGEFTERAFLNGKMDLAQAESVNDLIRAKDDLNAGSAVHGLNGSVARILNPLLDSLTQIIAQIEVNIDYPEYEDVHQLVDEELLPEAEKWLKEINALIEQAQSAMQVKDGIDTVILGRPNVGKSSLLNALLEEDKAIVTDIAGTTRDLVEGSVRVGNITLNLIDTAGIHESSDAIEQMGIERSLKALEQAVLVILVLDARDGITEEDQKLLEITKEKNRIVVYNKNDQKEVTGELSVSALNKDIAPLVEEIEKKYADGISAARTDTLNNARQIGLAMQARHSMEEAVKELKKDAEPDLVTIDLQDAWHALKEITGEAGHEDLLDEIFSRFCLGK